MIKKTLITIMIVWMANATYAQRRVEYTNTLSEMLVKSGSQETFKIILVQMTSMLKQQKPDVPETVWTTFGDDFANEALEELTILLSSIYQEHLSLEDLEGIIAFYDTPLGKKFAEKTPLITSESMGISQQWGMQLVTKIQQKLKDQGY